MDHTLARCRAVAGPKKFRFKDKRLSLDATMIDLSAERFPWATYQRKGAVKTAFQARSRWLSLRVTTLVETSTNALDLQIRTAPIAVLILPAGLVWLVALNLVPCAARSVRTRRLSAARSFHV